ncbi:hypothetical protein bcgnr5369_03350 [Bacillus cereus]|uniref:Uncharacterized protein n=1 Tax=Bacillus thuringiensis TaxID=1428 RepID=A0A9X6ZUS1_BACTU|nr:hypothetical protein [Bacillus thuringiensis]PFJ42773.1 hypothetical protein COJ15_05375 [Bacillus thuringiensis]
MGQDTLYQEMFEAVRTMDLIIKNVDTALECLEEMQKEGVGDGNWRMSTAILELKQAKERLGIDVF